MVQINGSSLVHEATTNFPFSIPMHERSFPEVLPLKLLSSRTTPGASLPSSPILEPELEYRYPTHNVRDSLRPPRYLERRSKFVSFSVVASSPPSKLQCSRAESKFRLSLTMVKQEEQASLG